MPCQRLCKVLHATLTMLINAGKRASRDCRAHGCARLNTLRIGHGHAHITAEVWLNRRTASIKIYINQFFKFEPAEAKEEIFNPIST